MNAAVTFEDLSRILKFAPPAVLQRVLGYAEALLENEEEKFDFELSQQQKNFLDKQDKIPIEKHINAETALDEIMKKHGL